MSTNKEAAVLTFQLILWAKMTAKRYVLVNFSAFRHFHTVIYPQEHFLNSNNLNTMLSDFRNPLSKRNFTLFGLWLIHFYWFKHILEDKEGCLICYLAQIFGRNKNRNVKKMGDVEKLWSCGNLHDILQPKCVFWRKWE